MTTDHPILGKRKSGGLMAAGIIALLLSTASLTFAQGAPVRIKRAQPEKPEAIESTEQLPVDAVREEGDVSRINIHVFNEAGAEVTGATVTLVEKETGRRFFTVSDSDGFATFNLLPKSAFEMTITCPGFAEKRGNIRISLQIEPTLSIVLPPASSSHYRIDFDDDSHEIPIFNSIKNGDLETVEAALNAGFKVNTKGREDKTALHQAVYYLESEIVELLLRKGAAVEARDEDKLTAVNILADDVGEDEEKVATILNLLIEYGADLDVANDSGETILMEAAYFDDPEIVTILLEAGVDTSLKNEDDETAYKLIEDERIREIFHRFGIFN